MKKRREIIIKSSQEEMFQVEQFIEEISDEHMLYGSYFGNILMAVTEAVQNAMAHGNNQEREKRIHIKEEMRQEGLWITVTDEGMGFNYKEFISDISISGFNTEQTGLLLIKTLCDEVKFMNNGTCIEMLFRINGIDEAIFNRRETFMQDFFRVYQRLNI
jgi:serine/threonine-protein kinase RsbW